MKTTIPFLAVMFFALSINCADALAQADQQMKDDATAWEPQYDVIRVNLAGVAEVVNPRLVGEGGEYRLAASSDPIAVCGLFHYGDAVAKSATRFRPEEGVPLVKVEASGDVVQLIKADEAISSLRCQGDLGTDEPRINYMIEVDDPIYRVHLPRVGWSTPFDGRESDLAGICHRYGYTDYVTGSAVMRHVRRDKAVTDAQGQVVRFRHMGPEVVALSCSTKDVEQNDDNQRIMNADGTVTIVRPRVVHEPVNGEIADQSDPDGVCRYLGFESAVPESITEDFWSRDAQQYIIDDAGRPKPRMISVGRIINQITCIYRGVNS